MTESIKFIIVVTIIFIVVIAIMVSLLPMSARKNMYVECENFNKQYGHPNYNQLSIYVPDDVLHSNEIVFYTDDPYFMLYDSEGRVVDIVFEQEEAVQRHKTEGLYIKCVYN